MAYKFDGSDVTLATLFSIIGAVFLGFFSLWLSALILFVPVLVIATIVFQTQKQDPIKPREGEPISELFKEFENDPDIDEDLSDYHKVS